MEFASGKFYVLRHYMVCQLLIRQGHKPELALEKRQALIFLFTFYLLKCYKGNRETFLT